MTSPALSRRLAGLVTDRLGRAGFARLAWGVLGYNLLVVLWGAVVRATGSGAGCGAHWPRCDGAVIPSFASSAMVIEFTHRLTSGLALVAVVLLAAAAWALWPRAHRVRRAAALALLFMLSEAAVGAMLVLLELVGHDDSVTRTLMLGVHLVNTFLLLAFIALTAWWASGQPAPRLSGGLTTTLLALALLGTLVVGVTGAMTALGDTLFRPTSLAEGVRQDFSPTAHFLIRLRVLHPTIAVLVGVLVAATGLVAASRATDDTTRRLGRILPALFALQLVGGLVNVALRAPVWMQLVHLLMADAVWLVLVLLTASALRAPAGARERGAERALHAALERA